MPSLMMYKSSLDYSYAPGYFPAMECLLRRSGCARRVLLSTSARGTEAEEKLLGLCAEKGIRWEYADRVLRQVSQKENCHAAAVFGKFQDELSPDEPHVVLVSPGDAGNVGTILRTALGLGYRDLCMVRPCVDVFDPRCVRASMGSVFAMRVHVFDSFAAYRALYPSHALYPFMLSSSLPMQEALLGDIPDRFALLFGNEGSGLPESFALLGQSVRIESSDMVDSLNLSVAAAIGLYAFAGKKGRLVH